MNRFNGCNTLLRFLVVILMYMSLAGGQLEKSRVTRQTNVTSERSIEYSSIIKSTTLRQNSTNSTTKKREPLFSEGTRTGLKIVTMSVAATGIVFNTGVIMAILIDPLKTLRRGAWITILNLAFADLFSCISCFCVWGQSFFQAIEDSQLNCAIVNFGWGFGVAASFLLLTFLTVQIYVITKFPLKSRFMFTEVKIVLSTMVIWLFAFVLGLSHLAYLRYSLEISLKIYAAQIGVLQIALFVQVFLNAHVCIEIMKSGRATCNAYFHQNHKHRNIAKTVIILTLILFVTAFPYFIFKQVEYLVRLGYLGRSKSVRILGFVSYCYAPIAVLNFTANPILYSLRLPDYRKTFFAFFGRNTGGKRDSKEDRTRTSLELTNAFYFQKSRRSPPLPIHRAAERLSIGPSNTKGSM